MRTLIASCLLFSIGLAVADQVQAQEVQFGKTKSTLGEVTEQAVEFTLDMAAVVREGSTVVDQSQVKIRRKQRRKLEAMQLDSRGVVSAARVTFAESRRAIGDAPPEQQLIEGKTYDCFREGEVLRVVCADGTLPSAEEFRLVSESLDSLGRPNPLADYFAGRRVRVGEKLALPPTVGAGLMARDAVGEVTRFEVTLLGVSDMAGTQVAQFETLIETHENSGRQLGLVVTGKLVLEVDSCRTRSMQLGGPIAMAESAVGVGVPQQMHGTGKLSVAIEAAYTRR